ncbi:hypothetical protein [Flavobacterium aurantiibacter]|uniref:Preprotein translocase subunit SecB n=1 Tax=Flavobacterium aurantiibacter TaxID=2023067 RepID=A0A256A260_9FLAO|nr:hypothetical protein [Flavobacterium aurantiibacter]OYQ47907.1 hypothetical protein CHX27_02700 [Flavobacterium aurantiibacter]
MAKIENKDFDVEMQIRAIELLNGSLSLSANPNTPVTNFNFNISIESRADAGNKLVFVIVHVEIKNDDHTVALGALSVSCIFEIVNFEDVIKVEADGKVNIPQRLIETLNMISISTTRGVMFSTFKGTFLHGAVLPIIDPKQFQVGSQKVEK